MSIYNDIDARQLHDAARQLSDLRDTFESLGFREELEGVDDGCPADGLFWGGQVRQLIWAGSFPGGAWVDMRSSVITSPIAVRINKLTEAWRVRKGWKK